MGTVLGAMRNVRWHELQHAYGSASQVPGVLSRIAWGDAPTSDEALSDLERWIGTPPVFDSTAATVPFLWELAATDTVRDRAGVLDLLATILAAGNPEHPAWTRAAHDAVTGAAPRPPAWPPRLKPRTHRMCRARRMRRARKPYARPPRACSPRSTGTPARPAPPLPARGVRSLTRRRR